MTEKRPSLAKKHTRQTTQNQEDALNVGAEFWIDGEHYKITTGDFTAVHDRALRDQVGLTFPEVLTEWTGANTSLVAAAAMVWLARFVTRGEDVTYLEVASEIRYDIFPKLREGMLAEQKRLADEAKPAAKKVAKKTEAESPEA